MVYILYIVSSVPATDDGHYITWATVEATTVQVTQAPHTQATAPTSTNLPLLSLNAQHLKKSFLFSIYSKNCVSIFLLVLFSKVQFWNKKANISKFSSKNLWTNLHTNHESFSDIFLENFYKAHFFLKKINSWKNAFLMLTNFHLRVLNGIKVSKLRW